MVSEGPQLPPTKDLSTTPRFAKNLPCAPEGKAYTARLMRGGVPEPAGTLSSHM